MKVLYILGYGRSGSTLLGNLLGEVPGIFSAGELHWFWQRALRQRCGCGELVPECPVWSSVLESGFGYPGPDAPDPAAIWALQRGELRVPHVWRILAMRHGISRPSLAEYAARLARLYEATLEVTEADVVVDSSKLPSTAALLQLMPAVDPYFVHLVRDPRAVAFSWQRRRKRQGVDWDEESVRHGPGHTIARWMTYNTAAEVIRRRSRDRFILVRYEDFVREPRATLQRILGWMGRDQSSVPFIDERRAELGVNHNVVGNPSRFKTGVVEIKEDAQWVDGLASWQRRAVTAGTLPLLMRYRYPVTTRRPLVS